MMQIAGAFSHAQEIIVVKTGAGCVLLSAHSFSVLRLDQCLFLNFAVPNLEMKSAQIWLLITEPCSGFDSQKQCFS